MFVQVCDEFCVLEQSTGHVFTLDAADFKQEEKQKHVVQ